jgi:hypothetical protein
MIKKAFALKMLEITPASAAFFSPLARILLAARGDTTLQADALAVAAGARAHAGWGFGCGGGFAVCFGNDGIAHENLS